MRTRIASIVVVVLMALILIPMAAWSNTDTPAAEPVVICEAATIGNDQLKIQCRIDGAIIYSTVVHLPQVTLPPLPQATVTVQIPGPKATQTIKVPVPGPTKTVTHTVTLNGPTATVTANGPTETAHATQTIKASPNTRPTQTVTTTTTATGQVDNGSATLEPSPVAPDEDDDIISLPSPSSPKGAVLGTLALILLAALILAALFGGYVLGYKEADVANATYMKRLLNRK